MAEVRSWCVPAEHPIFAGHFPGEPMVPGVMLLEWVLTEVADLLGRMPAALRVREAKFFAPLRPEQRAELHFDPGDARCGFEIRCDSVAIARGVLEWDGGG
jgi:3-hydroxyacyl-[acyl-carrier-protein] dehydratase